MNWTTNLSSSVEGGWLGWTLCDLAAARLSSCKVGSSFCKVETTTQTRTAQSARCACASEL